MKLVGKNKEKGSVLIVALILLAVLSILGFAITMTTRLDIQIAGNEYVAKQNLYAAEGAAMELIQEIEDGEEKMQSMTSDTPDWMIDNLTGQNNNNVPSAVEDRFSSVKDPEFPVQIIDTKYWEGHTSNLARSSSFINHGEAMAFFLGEVDVSSIIMGKTKLWDYRVFGRSNLYKGTRNDGWSIVEVGFRKIK